MCQQINAVAPPPPSTYTSIFNSIFYFLSACTSWDEQCINKAQPQRTLPLLCQNKTHINRLHIHSPSCSCCWVNYHSLYFLFSSMLLCLTLLSMLFTYFLVLCSDKLHMSVFPLRVEILGFPPSLDILKLLLCFTLSLGARYKTVDPCCIILFLFFWRHAHGYYL